MRKRQAVAATLVAALSFVAASVQAQDSLDALKEKCDGYGFVRGTPEHADCVRKLDAQRSQTRCQAIVQRAKQVCSKEYADIVSPVDAATECEAAQGAYQMYCQ